MVATPLCALQRRPSQLARVRQFLCALVVLPLLLAAGEEAEGPIQVDAGLPAYKQAAAVSGAIKVVGSDTMSNLVSVWGKGFQKSYPNVRIESEGKGSSTAPTALKNKTADFGAMSREMKKAEIDDFEKAFGYKPTQVPVAIDMLAVFVNKDNPITGLSLEQLDAVFSVTRKGGGKKELRTWGDLGLEGEWADKPVSLYGRNAASGTYGYFKEAVLHEGDFKATVKEQPGSSAVIQAVASDRYGLGYSGIGYKTPDVRAIALSRKGGDLVEATAAHAYDGKYPLSRVLLISLNQKPGEQLSPLKREFLTYVFSADGQRDVVKEGFFPVTLKMAEGSMGKLGLKLAGAKK